MIIAGDAGAMLRPGPNVPGRIIFGAIIGSTPTDGSPLHIGRPERFDVSPDGASGMCRIHVCDGAGEVLLSLGPFDPHEIVPLCHALGSRSHLALRNAGLDGSPLYRSAADLRAVHGKLADRRYLRVLTGRRPRFLTRRKVGRLSDVPAVHSEAELAVGRDR